MKLFRNLLFISILAFVAACDEGEPEAVMADFSYYVSGNNLPIVVTFLNTSTGATYFHWDFGDGKTSAEEMPQHTYEASGTYTVQLVAIGNGISDTTFREVSIDIVNTSLPRFSNHAPQNLSPTSFKASWSVNGELPWGNIYTYVQLALDSNFTQLVDADHTWAGFQNMVRVFENEHTFYALTPQTQYYYRVVLDYRYNEIRTFAYSDTVSAKTTPLPAPELSVTSRSEYTNQLDVYAVVDLNDPWKEHDSLVLAFSETPDFVKTEPLEPVPGTWPEPGHTYYYKEPYPQRGREFSSNSGPNPDTPIIIRSPEQPCTSGQEPGLTVR